MNELKHIAIIMDGNRRWATERGMPKIAGHTEGAKNIKRVVKYALEKGIGFITFYTLSTENLKNRSEEELKHLFSLIKRLPDFLRDFMEGKVKLNLIGDLSGLPDDVQESLKKVVENTKENNKITMILAINYGGRDEITRAVNKILTLKKEKINESEFGNYLDTFDLPDVDLVVRTAGDQRLSNFLPWQTVYAEIYFTETKWPAFDETEFDKALDFFYSSKRNNGK